MKSFTALLGASAGTHAADQLALASLPLTASLLLGAGPDLIGGLVAAQSAAWLLVTLPAGAWADATSRRRLLVLGLLLGLAGALAAIAGAVMGSALLLGLATFVAASGTVIYVLTAIALLPGLVAATELPRANARLELARAVVSLAAPLVAGTLAQALSPTWGYGLAAVGAAVALGFVLALPPTPVLATAARPSLAAAIRTGGGFVWRHALLRGISLCAVFWNFAFFALLAIWAPLALDVLRLDPARMGLAQSAYGAGLVLGALAAPAIARHLPPRAVLLFGPAVSVVAAGLFGIAFATGASAAGGFLAAAVGHFLVGFGPMLWLVCQTTVRQLVTPPPLLGRVNATVQVAIYGVRPLGALAGGLTAAQAGLGAALAMVGAAFALSTLVILLSPLVRLRALPQPVAA